MNLEELIDPCVGCKTRLNYSNSPLCRNSGGMEDCPYLVKYQAKVSERKAMVKWGNESCKEHCRNNREYGRLDNLMDDVIRFGHCGPVISFAVYYQMHKMYSFH